MASSTSQTSGKGISADGVSPIAIKQIVVSAVLPSVALVATGLRFLARRMRRVRPGIEDWLVVGGLIWTIGYAICNVLLVTVGGVGWSSAVLIEAGRNDRVIAQLKLAIAGQVLYALALGFIKVSICLQLIAIFWIHRLFRSLAVIVLILSICWSLQTILIGFLICRPLSHNWDTESKGTCGDLHGAYISVGIVDAITDAFIFMLPIPMIQTLKMPMRTKLATSAIFALGLLTIAAGIARTVGVSLVEFNPSDVKTGVELTMWSIVEPSVGVTVACMLVMRPLFTRVSESIASWSPWTSRNSDQNNSYDTSGKDLQGRQSPLDLTGHHFVNLDPESNEILLHSVSSAQKGYMNVFPAQDPDRDVLSSHSSYPTAASSSSSKKAFPIHIV